MKHLILGAVCALAMAFGSTTVQAADDYTDHVVNSTSRGLAMDGFDPVAYFVQGKPAKGDQAYRAEHKGRTWLFASAENRETFLSAPDSYAPQNNGWCAWAVAHGYAAEVDFIDGWFIADDKLYVTWSADVKERFLNDKDALLAQSQANWDNVHAGLQDGSVKFVAHSQRPNLGFIHPQQLPES
ncbi:YHS domain-containing protein [Tropicibacter sp. R16_0]|uniref:YHS domain-containing (seleno)protein n=1 Tax=Tropicibacter sp. R16_0 TaxID=2821102 RepID=UPI001ADC832B|nr:YHS domain-containing (seleno)protein [Tropicibacter sp. R16_0]MBO9449370.1 YHS domain-containing protein [Tropicibacter sp. R16_0]